MQIIAKENKIYIISTYKRQRKGCSFYSTLSQLKSNPNLKNKIFAKALYDSEKFH